MLLWVHVHFIEFEKVIWLEGIIRSTPIFWLVCGWGEDQRTNTMKTCVYNRLDCIFICLLTTWSTLNNDGCSREDLCIRLGAINNTHALPITISESMEAQFCSNYAPIISKEQLNYVCTIHLLGPHAFMSPHSFRWVREVHMVGGYYSVVTISFNRTPIFWLVCCWGEDQRTNTIKVRV